MAKTEIEKKAVCDKLFNPEKKVICPRCGNEIVWRKHGNSAIARCETPNCISGSIRGL